MTFEEYSREIARDFLLTALVIDDRAFEEEEVIERERRRVADSPSLRVPGSDPAPSERAGDEDEEDRADEPEDSRGSHDLDAPGLVAGFAKIGIFSSVVRPPGGGDALSRIVELARRADLLILDWQLRPQVEEDGVLALQVIEALAEEAVAQRSEFSERLTAILIYTGNADLEEIVGRVAERIRNITDVKPEELGDFSLRLRGIGVTVFAKDDTPIPEQTRAHTRLTSERELPRRAVDEFSSITSGLVPNAVLKGLSVLRSNTHRLIRVFSKELDGPYLAHRAMLVSPSDAEHYLVTLLAEEIGAALRDAGISECIGVQAIRRWLEHHWASLDVRELLNDGHDPALKDVSKLLRMGGNRAESEVAALRNQNTRSRRNSVYTRAFSPDSLTENQAGALDRRFAAVGLLERHYGESQPFLSLGVILASRERPDGDEMFWLCIQPACDSVRLEDKRAFPLLPLEKPRSAKRFDLIVPGEDGFRDLSIQYATHGLRMEEFAPTEGMDRVFPSEQPSGELSFVAVDDTRHYRFVGSLKWGQARRVMDRFAKRTGRVGLDESEWLRLHSPHR